MNEIDSMIFYDCICFLSLQWWTNDEEQSNLEFDSTWFSLLLNLLLVAPFVLLQPIAMLRFGPLCCSTHRRAALRFGPLCPSTPCFFCNQHDGWHWWRFVPSIFYLPLSLGALLFISSYALSSCHGRCKPLLQQQLHWVSSCWSSICWSCHGRCDTLLWQQPHQGSSFWSDVCWSRGVCRRNTSEKEESVTKICTRFESPKGTTRVDCWLFSS